MKSLFKIQSVSIAGGYKWKRGFGLGFRFYYAGKCTKQFTFMFEFANLEVHNSLLVEFPCTCEMPSVTKEML